MPNTEYGCDDEEDEEGYDRNDYWGDEPFEDEIYFADPGGNSSLRAGIRDQPCPTCEEADRLTKEDVALGYQCDSCADRMERGW